MQEIIEGVRTFQRKVFPHYAELFEKLAKGQSPEALVVTCSDSRVDPFLFMNAEPGQLFVLRNAGNIVPKYDGIVGGVTATIEFAVVALKVPNIIVCGHSGCGAINGLLHPESLTKHAARSRLASSPFRSCAGNIVAFRQTRRPRRNGPSGRCECHRAARQPARSPERCRGQSPPAHQAARLGIRHRQWQCAGIRRSLEAVRGAVRISNVSQRRFSNIPCTLNIGRRLEISSASKALRTLLETSAPSSCSSRCTSVKPCTKTIEQDSYYLNDLDALRLASEDSDLRQRTKCPRRCKKCISLNSWGVRFLLSIQQLPKKRLTVEPREKGFRAAAIAISSNSEQPIGISKMSSLAQFPRRSNQIPLQE